MFRFLYKLLVNAYMHNLSAINLGSYESMRIMGNVFDIYVLL